jgi:hypothetical protein
MSNGITRRELLGLALASPLVAALSFKGVAREGEGEGLDRSLVANSPGRVVGEGGAEDAAQVKLMREWRGTACLFNWADAPQSITLRLPAACQISDYWSGEDLGRHEGFFTSKDIPSHSARLLVCA